MSTTDNFFGYKPTWCPGCGNWGIGTALKSALSQLNFDPSSVFVVFGIGCSGNMNDFINAYAVHSLHGRAVPTAVGLKLANHKMPVVVIAGDGDCYGEGGNHFVHAARGNHDITVIVHDNRVYGLTTGQAAPTAQKGYRSKSTPSGIIEVPFNPMSIALSSGASFIAQTFAGDTSHMLEMIKKGIDHKGFSLINVMQPCVSFNKINTYQYYLERIYKIEEKYDTKDYQEAFKKAAELNKERFPLGIIYEEERSSFHEQIGQLKENKALGELPGFKNFDLLINEFI